MAFFSLSAHNSVPTKRDCRIRLHWVAALLLTVVGATLANATVSHGSAPHSWRGEVAYVVDGDTLHVRPLGGGKPVSLRLDGIDAPEICQTGGRAARDALKQRLLGRQVVVIGSANDRYQRLVARVELDGQDQGAWLVASGWAWAWQFGEGRGPYAAMQQSARLARKGLFTADPTPQTPKAFRQRHGSCYTPRSR